MVYFISREADWRTWDFAPKTKVRRRAIMTEAELERNKLLEKVLVPDRQDLGWLRHMEVCENAIIGPGDVIIEDSEGWETFQFLP